MSENLKNHINKFIKLSDEDFSEIQDYFEITDFKKKENLLQEGEICKSNFFVLEGCLRMFFINEKGIEQTIQFALENWWMTDYTAFSTQKNAGFYIQAVEDSKILALDFEDQEKLLEKFPIMERYFRLIQQRAHAASQSRIKILYELSKEQSYQMFIKLYPAFVQRIPQYLLASFLGFTPEYLSEIRNKKFS